MSTEPLLPRGFSRSGIPPDPDQEESRVLMSAHPSSSFVTIHLPIDPDLTETERLWYSYQLNIAYFEDSYHSYHTRTGGIRTLYLLERKSREELAQAGKKPVSKAKAEIVRSELACERIHEGLIELVETHDKFRTCYSARGELLVGPGRDSGILKRLSQLMDTDSDTLYERISEQMVSDARDINAEVFDNLYQLRGESMAVSRGTLLPRIAVVMALDIPYFVAPLAVSNAVTVPVEEIDFRERFNAIIDVLNTNTVRSRISACTTEEQLIDVAYDAVNRRSTVQIPNYVSYSTTLDFTFPLLDLAFDPETAVSKLSTGDYKQGQGGDHAEGHGLIIDLLFLSCGGVAMSGPQDTPVCLPNPDLFPKPTNQSIYGRIWEREFVYRHLVNQVLQRTVDRDNVPIQNPLDSIEIKSTAAENWEEPVEHARQVADAFRDVRVKGESELCRRRKQRRQCSW